MQFVQHRKFFQHIQVTSKVFAGGPANDMPQVQQRFRGGRIGRENAVNLLSAYALWIDILAWLLIGNWQKRYALVGQCRGYRPFIQPEKFFKEMRSFPLNAVACQPSQPVSGDECFHMSGFQIEPVQD